MTTLSITVPFHDDETIASYASRLAAANYASGVREFCGHMGLNHQKLIDGEPEEVARLMALADYELRSSDKRVVKRNGLFHEINGEVLARSSFLRSRLRHCPHCLAEDYENGSGVVTSRPYGRLAWCVTFIRTCPRHNVLLQLTERSSLEGGHDIAAMIAAWQRDPNVHPPAARCIQTDFESYVTERLWGRWDRRSWLDSLPLYVAGKMCEMVGATIRLGKRFVFDDLSEMDWVDSAQVGFEVLCKGEDAFRSFLEGLHSDFWDGEGDTGGRHLYGRLYERLAYESDDPAFDCVRAIMREVALSSIPFGPGDDMFGPVIERRFHTIQSASKEFNLHPLTLRKLLLKVGVIGTSAKDLTPDRILVPKDVVADVVAKYTSGMNWSKAWLYLNSGRTLWNTLTHGGYIPRAFADGHETGLGPIYAKSDLDAFLARMKTMVNQEFVACAKLTSFSKTVSAVLVPPSGSRFD
ncbi:hypothetical protein ILFOPFJJ_04832 [Ensifer psoraleae]|uniref:TniQ family protein n=1 Tax=Sinorhizobium psoraleae TaxID=520838 RepID=UPI00156A6333|nr:TniQ family protein [Sinorhizobium psoraleae]NRP73914.1 hypothetical protein [Sinorhizobium psoraleae]